MLARWRPDLEALGEPPSASLSAYGRPSRAERAEIDGRTFQHVIAPVHAELLVALDGPRSDPRSLSLG